MEQHINREVGRYREVKFPSLKQGLAVWRNEARPL
jgi:hypothetical protein